MIAVPPQVHLGLRALQFVLAALSLLFVSISFGSVDLQMYNLSLSLGSSLGSSAATFTSIVAYSAMVFALWYVVVVYIVKYAPKPTPQTDRVIDGVLAVLLFIAGIVLATSDYVSDCSNLYEGAIKCGNIKTAVAFTFITMAAFLVTFGLNFVGVSAAAAHGGNVAIGGTTATHEEMTMEYVAVATPYQVNGSPKDALSPIGNARSPAANV